VNIVTGKSVNTDDFPNPTRTNGMFGIWDKPAFGLIDNAAEMEDALPRELDDLEERVLVSIDTDKKERYMTGDAVNWTDKLGWYFFFNVDSEMGLNNLTIANEQVLTVTVSPAPPKTGAATDPCADSPVARLLAVDPITGLPNGLLGDATTTVDDVTTTHLLASTGVVDQKARIGNTQVGEGGNGGDSTKVDPCKGGSRDCTKVISARGEKDLSSSLGKGRIFWREIPGFKTN
jgi:Tfp pilus tip-associated adhesin PilY1